MQPPFYSRDSNEMYERILNEKLRFPAQVSESARSLISAVRARAGARRAMRPAINSCLTAGLRMPCTSL